VRIVYLDQNAASYLAKPDAEPVWKDIRAALLERVRDERLICPLPFEGVLETAPRPLKHRRDMQALFWQLSRGLAFKAMPEMSSELTLALVRPVSDWSPWVFWKPIWADMEAAAQKVSSDWRNAKLRMVGRMGSFVRSPNVETRSEREIFHSVACQRSVWICNDLDSLITGGAGGESLKCPWLIRFLVSQNISPAETISLKRAIQHHGWAEIPIHTFEILLGARWEYDSIRGGVAAYEPNDEIDRARAAIALSYADLFITEGGVADLCRRANVNDYCPTIVLSVRNPETILETIRTL
jgi:hypothetical protein